MAAQYPGAVPNFSGMVGTSTDPLSAPDHVALEQKQADEIVALATLGDGPRMQYGSGLWYSPDFFTGTNSQVNAVGDVRLFRCDFPPGTTITGLAINVVTGGSAGATKTLVIYNDDGVSSYPTTLQKATSALATTTTGVKSETFTAEDVSGVRWLGTLTLTNTSTITGNPNGIRGVGLSSIASANIPWSGYIQTGQTSAPGTFTSTRTTVAGLDRVLFQIG
jgi:hypothetical protein